MNYDKLDVNITLGVFGAVLGMLIGKIDGLLLALIVFMVIDYITGVLAAVVRKKVNSGIGYKGILKKAAMLLVVILGNVIDVYVLQNGTVCRTAVILFYLSNEGISICENYVEMGLPFPEKLKQILDQLNKES